MRNLDLLAVVLIVIHLKIVRRGRQLTRFDGDWRINNTDIVTALRAQMHLLIYVLLYRSKFAFIQQVMRLFDHKHYINSRRSYTIGYEIICQRCNQLVAPHCRQSDEILQAERHPAVRLRTRGHTSRRKDFKRARGAF